MDMNQEKDSQEMNSGVRIACGALLVAIVTAAGVGLLVQHRTLDELRRAHAGLAREKQKLVEDHLELVSANQKMESTLRELRQRGLAWAAERTAIERERAKLEQELKSWKAGRTSVESERAALKAEAASARAAQARAEKEASALKASELKLKALVKKTQDERDRLERELNEAMRPALESALPAKASDADAVAPAPPPDKLTPEARAAQGKEELKDLIGL